MNRSSRIALFALVVVAGTPYDLAFAAQELELHIDQTMAPGKVTVVDSVNAGYNFTVGTLGKPDLTVYLKPRQRVQFMMQHAIPVLFEYELKRKELVNTENFDVAIQFLKSIAPLAQGETPLAAAAALSIAEARSSLDTIKYEGTDLCSIQETARALANFDELARGAVNAAIADDQAAVDNYKRQLRSLGTSIRKLSGQLQAVDNADYISSSQAHSQKGRWNIAGQEGQGTLDELQSSVHRETPEMAGCVDATIAMVKRQALIKATTDLASEFVTLYEKTFQPLPIGESFDYDKARIAPVDVVVAANRQFSKLLPDSAAAYQDARVGTYAISVAPYERLQLSIDAGVIYSFVRNPEFGTATDSAGVIKIVKTEDDYAKLDGAVILNVTGSDWALFGVHPFWQLGLVPSSENLAILAGGGIKLFDKGALALGAIYQRVKRLSPTQNEGGVLAKAEDLVTSHEFKPGLYVSLSIQLK